jgi:hypothetical protein
MMAEHMTKMNEGKFAEPAPADPVKAYMSEIGRRGGKVSGARRMKNLSAERRAEIARLAAKSRWKKS